MNMTTPFLRSLWSISTLLILLTPCLAQVDSREKAKKEEERKQELKRKTYALVDDIAIGALSIKLPENQSFILAEAADLLWDRDEKRARNLFWDAFNAISLMTPQANGVVDKKKAQSAFFQTYGLRRELLLRVAQRDGDLAMDMMRSVPPLPPEFIPAGYLPDLEQEIGAQAAARDPKRAFQIAHASLAKGLSYTQINLLWRLNALDRELGLKFAGELIDKIQTKNMSIDRVASHLAVGLLTSSRRSSTAAVIDNHTEPGPVQWRPLDLSREQKRQLVEMITNAALALGAKGELLYDVSDVMQEIEELAPERAGPLEKKLAAFNQTLNKEQSNWQQYNSLIRKGTPEEIVAAAQNADNDQRRMLQQQAIVIAVMRKRADSLREYIVNEIKDDSARKELLDSLDQEAISAAANRGNAEELQKLISQVRLKEERARAMAEMAVLLEKKNEHEEALKLLAEAETLIKNDFSSETQTNALLALVVAYALVDPSKAFPILEAAMERANDQISKAVLLDKIVKTGAIKKGEIILQNSGVSLDLIMFKHGKGLAALAEADFDRTKGIADRLERNELRLMARLTMAKLLLLHNTQSNTRK